MSWPLVKLKDCCDVVGGATPKRNFEEYWSSHDIPWVTPKDVSNLDQPVLDDAPEYISHAGFKSCATYMLPKGSVLLTSRAPIGNLAIVGRDMCTNQGFKSLVPGDEVDGHYLYYCMHAYSERLQALGNGATFKEVSKKTVEEFEIPLPPLAEQKRIAAILDKADAIRRKHQQAIKLADEFLRATFLDLFGDPYSNQKGWEVLPLKELGRAITGSTPPSKKDGMWGDEIPFITPGDLDSNLSSATRWVTKEGANNSRLCREGSLLACCIGATIGKVGLAEVDSTFNQQINAQEWNKKIDDVYGYALFKLFPELITANAIQTTLPILKKSLFEAIEIPVPEISLQKKYKLVFKQIEKNKQRWINKLGNDLFSSLSQKAFSGNL